MTLPNREPLLARKEYWRAREQIDTLMGQLAAHYSEIDTLQTTDLAATVSLLRQARDDERAAKGLADSIQYVIQDARADAVFADVVDKVRAQIERAPALDPHEAQREFETLAVYESDQQPPGTVARAALIAVLEAQLEQAGRVSKNERAKAFALVLHDIDPENAGANAILADARRGATPYIEVPGGAARVSVPENAVASAPRRSSNIWRLGFLIALAALIAVPLLGLLFVRVLRTDGMTAAITTFTPITRPAASAVLETTAPSVEPTIVSTLASPPMETPQATATLMLATPTNSPEPVQATPTADESAAVQSSPPLSPTPSPAPRVGIVNVDDVAVYSSDTGNQQVGVTRIGEHWFICEEGARRYRVAQAGCAADGRQEWITKDRLTIES